MKRRILGFSGLFVLFLLLSIFSSSALAIQYKVKSGDSLYSISKKYGVSVKQIKQTNNIRISKIRKNQVLNISTKKYSKHTNKSKSERAPVKRISAEDNAVDEEQSLVKVATGFTGTPYEFGGSSLEGEGIDCSSFVQQIYRKFDIKLPRSAREQAEVGIRISRKDLMKGDLVFFKTYRSLGHVGIYIGNNEFVHAATEGGVVRIDSIGTPYYRKRFQRAVRVVKGFNHIGA